MLTPPDHDALVAAIQRASDDPSIENEAEMLRLGIRRVMDAIPDLTRNGFGLGHDASALTPEERDRRRVEWRSEMLADGALVEFAAACLFLSTCGQQRTINPITSYSLKHSAEWASRTYIANGMFIAAAAFLGFRVRRIENTPNACINVRLPKVKGHGSEAWKAWGRTMGGGRRLPIA